MTSLSVAKTRRPSSRAMAPTACRCPGTTEFAGREEGVGVVVHDGTDLDLLFRVVRRWRRGDGDARADGDRSGFSFRTRHGSDSGRAQEAEHPNGGACPHRRLPVCLFTGDSEMVGDGQIAAVGVRQSCVDAGLTDAACWGAVWVAHRVGV